MSPMRFILSAMLMLFVIGAVLPTQAQENETKTDANLVEVLRDQDQFSTLLSVAEKAKMVSTLASEGPFTVLAPTDKAFAEFEGDVESLSTEETQALLRNHLLEKPYPASKVATMDSLQTLTGTVVSVEDSTDGVAIKDGMVVEKDIKADNGVVHAVDDLIVPSDMSEKIEQMETAGESAE